MKPFCTFPLLLTLLLALGCGGDDEAADKKSSDATIPDEGNQAAGGQQGMGPDGQGGGAPGGEGGMGPDGQGGGAPGGEDGFGGAPGGEGGGFGGATQPQQPTFDPNLPAGKKQVWTKAKLETASKGKSAADLVKQFGKPASWKQQRGYTAYIYDKMYVKDKNMKYSQVTFAVQPDSASPGGGKIIAIGLVPSSGTRIQPAGGQNGFPGQGGGFPGGDPGGGGPPGGFPGGGYPGGAPPGGNRPK